MATSLWAFLNQGSVLKRLELSWRSINVKLQHLVPITDTDISWCYFKREHLLKCSSRHSLQNLCPHLVRTGSFNASWQIKQWKSSQLHSQTLHRDLKVSDQFASPFYESRLLKRLVCTVPQKAFSNWKRDLQVKFTYTTQHILPQSTGTCDPWIKALLKNWSQPKIK